MKEIKLKRIGKPLVITYDNEDYSEEQIKENAKKIYPMFSLKFFALDFGRENALVFKFNRKSYIVKKWPRKASSTIYPNL